MEENCKAVLILLVGLLIPILSSAQTELQIIIKDSISNEPVSGAKLTIDKNRALASNSKGIIEVKEISAGKHLIQIIAEDYRIKVDTFNFPLKTSPLIILISAYAEEMEEVVVSSTRSSRTIDDIPTRVETISAEELNEKATMQPGNVRMVLSESTGIQTQQTSATSANASIRIQGMDGKYTQLLKDGFPLYSGFSGGLSLLQIPPLDLKRVEVIKGSSSTLYGGGAIAGLVNFVTKEPAAVPELSAMVNVNQTKAADLSAYYGKRSGKLGWTIFAAQNSQKAYDVNKDVLSDIPKFYRLTFNPRLFYYPDSLTKVSFGVNTSFENRIGGDIQLIEHGADLIHTYFEENNSRRYSSQFKLDKSFSGNKKLTLKNSLGYFNRSIQQPDYLFEGVQYSSFSEATYLLIYKKSEWVIGSNVWTDKFTQPGAGVNSLNSSSTIGGVFAQNSFKANDKLIMETGLRVDFNNEKESFLLPRVAIIYKPTSKLTLRANGGLGYKTPTVFSEETEEMGFQNIMPIDFSMVKSERSIGGNFDVNYKTYLTDEISFSVNQMFFVTRINRPVILIPTSGGAYNFANAYGFLNSKGFETNVKVAYDDLSFYLGYTFTNAKRHINGENYDNPLTAKNRIYFTAMYEIERKLNIGFEAFYTGKQHLSNFEEKPSYVLMGVSAERKFERLSLFINAENFTDRRQSRFGPTYTGTIQHPSFEKIWAPTDGFILNGGFKYRF